MEQEDKIEKFFCNKCKGKTRHFIRAEHRKEEHYKRDGTTYIERNLVAECCGCEKVALIKKTHFSEHYDHYEDPVTGESRIEAIWEEEIYPPVSYRASPAWFDDLPDELLQNISAEIYKSLQSSSHYLATFGSRTLIDRLIVLTVGDKGNFPKGLQALQDDGKLSAQERQILEPVVNAGNAAAHRGWDPSKEQIAVILDTVEGLIHRLLVLPKLAEELEVAVPKRHGAKKPSLEKTFVTMSEKIKTAPKNLQALYDELANLLKGLGEDVAVNPQKHYIAFKRNRNFASVQIYHRNRTIKVYLNIDPTSIYLDESIMRDVRNIGHFGTGDLEITIKSKDDIDRAKEVIKLSYQNS